MRLMFLHAYLQGGRLQSAHNLTPENGKVIHVVTSLDRAAFESFRVLFLCATDPPKYDE